MRFLARARSARNEPVARNRSACGQNAGARLARARQAMHTRAGRALALGTATRVPIRPGRARYHARSSFRP
eukprot:8893718-Alexandrium_andersonii.AAC.1